MPANSTLARTFARVVTNVAQRSPVRAQRPLRVARTAQRNRLVTMTSTSSPIAEKSVASEPRWDLEKHFGYASASDTKIDDEMTSIERACEDFKKTFEGKLDAELLEAI